MYDSDTGHWLVPDSFVPFNELTDWLDHAAHLKAHREYQAMIKLPDPDKLLDPDDPLDQPITLRDLIETAAEVEKERRQYGLERNSARFSEVVKRLQEKLSTTDFIGVRFGGAGGYGRQYVYKVAAQPAGRRVQVGDLVTVPANVNATQPQVVRVSEINVKRPHISTVKAVAISPDDAARIEAAVGPVLPRPVL